ncbi:MAG: hypothetical protein R6U41_03675 [Desulfosalsimonas sp.]|uniref:hypothetical protein n=1 Tax=Desulfosalsimonas sp. TaxID=3073848 RepID=UPI003970D420
MGTPKWVMPAVQTEYFIKTGLVLLGAEILFGKIFSIGIPGIFVAWVVTPTVLITTTNQMTRARAQALKMRPEVFGVLPGFW